MVVPYSTQKMGGLFQTPFAGPEEVVKYIGRYTHRAAISNNRIISVENGIVKFWYKNTRKDSHWETTSLPVMTFIKRFLDHVLPKHFHRIRYYGFLANGHAGSNIEKIRHSLSDKEQIINNESDDDQGLQCPSCQDGTMITFLVIDGYGNVVMDELPDPVKEFEPQMDDSS